MRKCAAGAESSRGCLPRKIRPGNTGPGWALSAHLERSVQAREVLVQGGQGAAGPFNNPRVLLPSSPPSPRANRTLGSEEEMKLSLLCLTGSQKPKGSSSPCSQSCTELSTQPSSSPCRVTSTPATARGGTADGFGVGEVHGYTRHTVSFCI